MTTSARAKGTPGLLAVLLRYRTPLFLFSGFLWLLVHSSPLLFGTLNKGLFDALAAGPGSANDPWIFLLWLGLVEFLRIGLLGGGILTYSTYIVEIALLLRRNLIDWLFTAPGRDG